MEFWKIQKKVSDGDKVLFFLKGNEELENSLNFFNSNYGKIEIPIYRKYFCYQKGGIKLEVRILCETLDKISREGTKKARRLEAYYNFGFDAKKEPCEPCQCELI